MSDTDTNDPAQRLPTPMQQVSQRRPDTNLPTIQSPDDVPPSGSLFSQAVDRLRPPPPRAQPFWTGFADSPPSAWGKPDWALEGAMRSPGSMGPPYMPGPSDVGPLLNRSLGGLQQIGSPMVAQLAGHSAAYQAAFVKAYNAQEEHNARMYDLKYKQNHDRMIDRQQQESQAYGIAFETYKDNPPKLEEEVRNIARELGDTKVTSILDAGGPKAFDEVTKLIQAREHFNLPLMKLREETRRMEIEERRAATQERAETRLEKEQEAIDKARQAWTGKTPAETTPDRTTTDPTKPPAPGPTKPPVSTGALPNPREEELAQEILAGNKPDMPKNIPGLEERVAGRVADLHGQINQAVADGTDRESRLNALQGINPALANTMRGVLEYKLPVHSRAGVLSPLAQLAEQIDPDWDQSVSQFVTEFRNPNSNTGKTMQRSNTMAQAALEVMRAEKALLDSGKVDLNTPAPFNSVQAWLDNNMQGAGEWTDLYSALNTYIQEAVAVTRGGTGAEGDINRQFAFTKPTGSVRQILGTLKIDSATAYARVTTNRELWRDQTKRKDEAPGFNAWSYGVFNDIKTLDPKTFKFGPKVSPELRELEPAAAAKAAAKTIDAPPGATEGEVLYNKGQRYRIQGGKAVPF